MSRLAVYDAVLFDVAGRSVPRGSTRNATERTITGDKAKPSLVTLAAGEKRIVWDYARDGYAFELCRIKVGSDGGYIRGALKIDTPTSAGDLTPTGAKVRARHFECSCLAAHMIDTDAGLAGSTLALDAGWVGTYPDCWGDGARADARVYQIALWNPGTDPVEVEVDLFN